MPLAMIVQSPARRRPVAAPCAKKLKLDLIPRHHVPEILIQSRDRRQGMIARETLSALFRKGTW